MNNLKQRNLQALSGDTFLEVEMLAKEMFYILKAVTEAAFESLAPICPGSAVQQDTMVDTSH